MPGQFGTQGFMQSQAPASEVQPQLPQAAVNQRASRGFLPSLPSEEIIRRARQYGTTDPYKGQQMAQAEQMLRAFGPKALQGMAMAANLQKPLEVPDPNADPLSLSYRQTDYENTVKYLSGIYDTNVKPAQVAAIKKAANDAQIETNPEKKRQLMQQANLQAQQYEREKEQWVRNHPSYKRKEGMAPNPSIYPALPSNIDPVPQQGGPEMTPFSPPGMPNNSAPSAPYQQLEETPQWNPGSQGSPRWM